MKIFPLHSFAISYCSSLHSNCISLHEGISPFEEEQPTASTLNYDFHQSIIYQSVDFRFSNSMLPPTSLANGTHQTSTIYMYRILTQPSLLREFLRFLKLNYLLSKVFNQIISFHYLLLYITYFVMSITLTSWIIYIY